MVLAEAYQLIGSYNLVFAKKYDEALKHYDFSISEYSKCDTNYCKIKILGLEINKAICYQKKGEYQKSLQKLDSLNT